MTSSASLRHAAPGATSALAAGAVLIIPAGILVSPDLAEGAFYLLALLGAVHLARNRTWPPNNPQLRVLGALTTGFFAAAVLSLVASGSDFTGFERLDRSAHFLAAPLVALLLHRISIDVRLLMLAVKLGALIVCAVALLQYSSGTVRAGGSVNPLLFGALSLLLGFFSLVRLPQETAQQKALSLLAFCAGGTACVLSQSRGVWIESAALLAVVLYFWFRAGLLSKRLLVGISAVFLSMVTVSCNTSLVQNRIGTAVAEYQALRDHGQWQTSVAIRVIMWQSGLRAATHRPLLGWGPHRTQQATASVLGDPAVQHKVLQYTHLHNEYLTTLVGRGVVGVFSLLLLLLVPVFMFVKQAHRPELLAVNSIGTLLCVGYALSGLTNLAFGHDVMNVFFVTVLSLTLPALGKREVSLQEAVFT